MGVTFRSGDYVRFVRMGGRTIKDGEAAAVWNCRGEHQKIVGPRRVWLWFSTIRFLTRSKAEPGQYLRIRHRNGTLEHLPGPCEAYCDPRDHDGISVEEGIRLGADEVLLVSRMPAGDDEALPPKTVDGTVLEEESSEEASEAPPNSRRLVRGPTLFVPSPNESVEEFEWSVLPSNLEPATSKGDESPALERFSKISLDTNRTWRVEATIGAKPADVRVVLSITLRIQSLEKVIATKDPHKALCTALMADVGGLVLPEPPAGATALAHYEALREHAAAWLGGGLEHLCTAAHACGTSVPSVGILGIAPGGELRQRIQREHERHALALERAAQKESSIRFRDLDLEEERKTIEHRVELERQEAKLRADLSDQIYLQRVAALDQEHELAQKEMQRKIDSWKASDEVVLDFFGRLKDLGVDMSEFLCTVGGKETVSDILNRAPSLAQSVHDQSKELGSNPVQSNP